MAEGRAKGGHARAKSLTPERRSEIASAAAKTRWEKMPRRRANISLSERDYATLETLARANGRTVSGQIAFMADSVAKGGPPARGTIHPPRPIEGVGKPVRRDVHDYAIRKSSGTRTIRVVEIEHPGFILMTATTSDPAFDFVRADYLSGIVAQRMEEGWTLMTVTDSSATLRR